MTRNTKPICMDALSEQGKDFYKAINEGSDLACILISTSYLDQCLSSLLSHFFKVGDTSKRILDSMGGAIGTFSVRNDLCYCLGLISKKNYQNIRTSIEIRNEFAHSHILLSFNDVSAFVDKLTFPYDVVQAIRIENGESIEVSSPFSGFTSPRVRFSIIMTLLVNDVIVETMSTRHIE